MTPYFLLDLDIHGLLDVVADNSFPNSIEDLFNFITLSVTAQIQNQALQMAASLDPLKGCPPKQN